jgi:hypothetical protein
MLKLRFTTIKQEQYIHFTFCLICMYRITTIFSDSFIIVLILIIGLCGGNNEQVFAPFYFIKEYNGEY